MIFAFRRVYDEPAPDDGVRVLVDHLWPRGLSLEKARVDLWLKNIAPGEALYRWYGFRVKRWEEFRLRYREELQGKPELTRRILSLGQGGKITLVSSAQDTEHNGARVLVEYLREIEAAENRGVGGEVPG